VRRGAVAGNRIVLVLVIAALFVPVLALGARAQGPRVLVAEIAGAIDQSTLEYMTEAVNEAVQGGYAALVIRFDTPGGALAETEAIASLLLSARIPVLGWVGPVGAHSRGFPSSAGSGPWARTRGARGRSSCRPRTSPQWRRARRSVLYSPS